MIDSQDLRIFAAVVGAPSLAAAARSLDVTLSAVTQRLRQLEQRLGVRLAAEGQMLAERGASVMREMEAIDEALASAAPSYLAAHPALEHPEDL